MCGNMIPASSVESLFVLGSNTGMGWPPAEARAPGLHCKTFSSRPRHSCQELARSCQPLPRLQLPRAPPRPVWQGGPTNTWSWLLCFHGPTRRATLLRGHSLHFQPFPFARPSPLPGPGHGLSASWLAGLAHGRLWQPPYDLRQKRQQRGSAAKQVPFLFSSCSGAVRSVPSLLAGSAYTQKL